MKLKTSCSMDSAIDTVMKNELGEKRWEIKKRLIQTDEIMRSKTVDKLIKSMPKHIAEKADKYADDLVKKNKQIETLRTVFRISVAAFEFAHKVASATGKYMATPNMETLHRIALSELEKENPNMQYVDSLLGKMEELATQNAAKNEP